MDQRKKDLQTYLNQGNKLRAEGNLEGAKEKYLLALKLNPNNIPALLHLAGIYENQEELATATTHITQAINIDKDNGFVQARLGSILIREEKIAAAIIAFEKSEKLLLKKSPLWMYLKWGEALEKKDKIEEAIAVYQKAIANHPDINPQIYQKLGEACEKNGRVEEAIATYEQIINKLKQNNPKLYISLAKLYLEKGKLDSDAITVYQKVIEINPEISPFIYHKIRELCNKSERVDEVIQALKQTIKYNQENYSFHLMSAQLYLEKGELDGVIDSYKQAIKLKPDLSPWIYQSSYLSRSQLYFEQGQFLHQVQETPLIVGVSMFKNEADIVYHNLAWQYNLGIKRFVLLDNMSEDNTVEEIKRFVSEYTDAMVYLVKDKEFAHYQGKKMTAASELAYKMWKPEWIALFDADELLCSTKAPLHTVLKSVPSDCLSISIPLRNHVLTSKDDDTEPNPIKRMTHRKKHFRRVVKVIVRWLPGMIVGEGNHQVILKNQPILTSIKGEDYGLFIRHYPYRSKEHLRQKIIRAKSLDQAQDLKQGIGGLWRKHYSQYKIRGEKYIDELYNSMLVDPDDCIYDPALI